MKAKLLTLILLAQIVFLEGCTSINGTGPCITQYGCKRSMVCANGPNCECTDPGCYSGNGNFCLSTGKCCRAFGNMAGRMDRHPI